MSVAKVFSWLKVSFHRHHEEMILFWPGSILRSRILRTLGTDVGTCSTQVCQNHTRSERQQVLCKWYAQASSVQYFPSKFHDHEEALTHANKIVQSSIPIRLTIHIRVANRKPTSMIVRTVNSIVVAKRPAEAFLFPKLGGVLGWEPIFKSCQFQNQLAKSEA